MRLTILFLIAILAISCVKKEAVNMDILKKEYVNDIHSYARPNEAVVKHIDLDLEVDFDNKVMLGSVALTFEAADDAEYLILDTKGLKINSITTDKGNELPYTLGVSDPILGAALKINIDNATSSVIIDYVSEPSAEAVQWLDPVQTAGKTDPFLFTQSQAILARTWIPLQDSPGIRFTYNAHVKVPSGLLALMSAENPVQKSEDGMYNFKMNQPIPAYLMALVVGNLEFKSLGDRTGVYAEPLELEASAYEFAETEKMIEIAEGLYGPYKWERYDMVVLPPSFPFGGMENPRLTFVTPTIIAGDRSLVSLIAHELAHSWSGNLVTNATWNDFWINEGFTVYFEDRIMEELYGKSYAEMLASLNQQDLKIEVENFINDGAGEDTKLKLDLTGRNPDDGVTTIPYDKGYSFLRYIEDVVGRDKFDTFLKEYFSSHAFQTMTTEGFISYLQLNLFEKNEIPFPQEKIEQWIYQEGLPPTLIAIKSDRFKKVETQIDLFINGEKEPSELGTSEWTTHEWLHFIKNLPQKISIGKLTKLDQQYKLTESGNSEILDAWFVLAIKNDYEIAYPAMKEFLINTGRRKLLTPIYTELIGKENTKELAMEIYKMARPNYHSVSVNTLDELLGWKN